MKYDALVTGASSGIGRAISLQLAEMGCKVLALGRNIERLNELQKLNSNIHYIAADLSLESEQKRVITEIEKHSNGNLKFLVNCAATLDPIKPMTEITSDEWAAHFATNLHFPLLITRSLLPKLEQNQGRALFLLSDFSTKIFDQFSLLCMSKTALTVGVKCLKLEVGQKIPIAGVLPGPTDTPIYHHFWSSYKQPSSGLSSTITQKKPSDPDDIAKFISWLLFDVKDTDFTESNWDFRNSNHHLFWNEKIQKQYTLSVNGEILTTFKLKYVVDKGVYAIQNPQIGINEQILSTFHFNSLEEAEKILLDSQGISNIPPVPILKPGGTLFPV